MSTPASAEHLSATRTVAAPPAAVFALLSDPDRHQETEPSDWVRGAVQPGVPLTAVGQVDEAGRHDAGGWTWRYDLAPAPDGGTEVTLTYDWSATPAATREEIGGTPPFPPALLEESLAALDRAVS